MMATLVFAAAAWALVVVALAPTARGAAGDLEITTFELAPRANPMSPDALQAGAHPDLRILMRFCGSIDPAAPAGACTAAQNQVHLKDLTLRLPRGLWANPGAVSPCETHQFLASACPPETVVGQLTVTIDLGGVLVPLPTPLYNVRTTGLEFARIGTLPLPTSPPTPLSISATVDAGDGHRLLLTANDIPGPPSTKVAAIDAVFQGTVAGKPFITNPTSCDPATAGLEVRSWATTTTVVRGESTFRPQRCEAVPFHPTPTMAFNAPAQPGSPGDWEVAIQYPCADPTPTATRACSEGYENEPIWQSQLKDIELTLPEGVGVAAAAAKGLEACTPEQFRIDEDEPVDCPDGSRVGSLRVESPLLSSGLQGQLFFGPPTSSGRPTPERPWNILFLIEGEGLRVKLAGTLTLDENGRVKIQLGGLPVLPLSRLELHLSGGAGRAPILTNPLACGEHTGDAVLTDWSGRSVTGRPVVNVTHGCLSGEFEPVVEEVSAEPAHAGSSSSIRIVITRPESQRLLKGLSMSLPKGANGAVAAVPRCPLSQARTAGRCDEASRIGEILTTLGSTDDSVTLSGSIYLAGASVPGDAGTIAIVTPVHVGPIDLGPMVILARAMLRPFDGGLDIASIELPLVFEGVSLLLRRIELVLNRQGFFSNPTGCEPRPAHVTFTSDNGRTITRSRSFAATGCDRLPFSPKLRLVTGTRRHTGTDSHPPLRAIITQAIGESAIEKTVIAIPAVGMNIPQLKRPDAVCEAAELRTRDCPPLSHVGAVKVNTPLLPFPLSGPVFAVPEQDSPLPALAMVLRGGGLTLQLRARNSLAGTTFEALPDIPITRLKLRINGGSDGMLTTFSDLCGRNPPSAESTFASQSGRALRVRPQLVVNGCLKRATRILNRRVRVSRSGTARVRLRCRRDDRCDGRLLLRAVARTGSTKTKRRLRLGAESFRISGGRTRSVEVRLTAAGRKAALRYRRLLATATVRVGNSETNRRIRLMAPVRTGGGPGGHE
jgi:hypothetical protein